MNMATLDKAKKPMVSVRLMTYNHEKYIAEAIEGCIMQKCQFDFEVIIGDDFSHDNTLKICKEYESRYPDLIKVLDRKEGDEYWSKRQKFGRLYNFSDILNHCKGKYIALLDGDDYWTDPMKLQKQVDLLEKNKELSACFHNVKVIGQGAKKELNSFNDKQNIKTSDIIKENLISKPSLMFRNHNKALPMWFMELPAGDWGLHILNSTYGNIQYMDFIGAAYRKHNEGVWIQLSRKEIGMKGVTLLQKMDKAFEFKYHEEMEDAINRRKDKFDLDDISFPAMIIKRTKRMLKKIFNS